MASQPSVAKSACMLRRSPAFSMAAAMSGLSSTMRSLSSRLMAELYRPARTAASSTLELESLRDAREKHVVFHGLANEIGRPDLERLQLHFLAGKTGDEDRRDIEAVVVHRLQQAVTVDVRQIDIEQQEVDARPSDDHQRFGAVFRDEDVVAGALEERRAELTTQHVVFDDEHVLARVFRRCPRRAGLRPQCADVAVEGLRFRVRI